MLLLISKMLYNLELAVNGQEELCKSMAQEALRWAQLTDDWRNSVRIYLLLAAVAG